MGRGWRTFIAAMLMSLFANAGAHAHGKEVNIGVTCITPDPARPLTKLCTATLKYLDGEPVLRGRVVMTADREGGPTLAPAPFKPLEEDGVYSLAVTFPAYGKWRMRFEVAEPGRGTAQVQETLLPPLPGTAPELRAQLQVVLQFGLADARHLAVRIVHFLAATSWFAVVFLVLVLSAAFAPEQRRRSLELVSRAFPWAAGGSLFLITTSGIYNARYNVPTRPPGLFAPGILAGLPFGKAYLVAFLVKMGLMLAIVGATATLGFALRRTYSQPAPIRGGMTTVDREVADEPNGRTVRWLAALNLILGLLIFADVVVLGYLHIISHVGGAAGAR